MNNTFVIEPLRGGLGGGEMDSLPGEQLPEREDDREDFIIPVGPLSVVRGLFRLDHVPILGKYTLRKQNNKRPKNIHQAWDSGLANHHETHTVIDPLLAVHRNIGQPEV